MAQCSGKMTLYEGKHFTGRKLEVFGDCDNFQDRGFMNRVNSIRVESGAWVCYNHPDFRGQQFVLEHGDYPDFFCWNSHNDHMGSCWPVGMSQGWAKNCVNAIKVYGDGGWVLYEEPNYCGRMYLVERATSTASPIGRLTVRVSSPSAGLSSSSSLPTAAWLGPGEVQKASPFLPHLGLGTVGE